MSGTIGGPQTGLSSAKRIAAAVGVFLAIEISINFALAFHGTRGPQNALFWLVPVLPIAWLFFHSIGVRLGMAIALALLVFPAAIVSELLAHLFGACLY
ncbi:MAG: hypothetical protein MT490_19250 [Sphingomonas sp.]|uniref:hypothetical protein n=1 Tax=Sphingomonas sp. TaxID=28214 RepID=UPI002274F656|nr:hypothetical protein [Sphingomonas sp.]MCX8477931.1 hypothetical protein [Sphingomonas sp.]